MRSTLKIFCLYALELLFFSCGDHNAGRQNARPKQAADKRSMVIVIQPFVDFPDQLSRRVYDQLRQINPAVFIRKKIPIPPSAWYAPRKRYRADSIIAALNRTCKGDTVIIGLVKTDISTTKDEHDDWGVMGLGYCPGNACVVSIYRLKKKNLEEQFYKVAIHELGHTQGLPHCTQKTCFMRDAEGGNPLNEEKEFCTFCREKLEKKGWRLH